MPSGFRRFVGQMHFDFDNDDSDKNLAPYLVTTKMFRFSSFFVKKLKLK
jgi:hypothetical protein